MAKRKGRGGKRSRKSGSRRIALKLGLALTVLLLAWGLCGEWFVHHPRTWIAAQPSAISVPLLWLGNPLSDITDALDWTGHDTVYEYDIGAPSGSVLFAGAPRRVAPPAPSDIRIIDRGEFVIGWSDSLRHPVWCAYHVPGEARHPDGRRPGFILDRSIPSAPSPSDYANSGFDRGHMVPNHAIASRFGKEEQRKTFMMSNVAPQSPALNRGIWRDVEHRIADLWTARYGEIWVVVGCFTRPCDSSRETLSGTSIDIPSDYYMVVLAQEGLDIRALAVICPQTTPWHAWPARALISIDELEELTGLDFNPELPSFIQDPLESELPSRLWPIRVRDLLTMIMIHYNLAAGK